MSCGSSLARAASAADASTANAVWSRLTLKAQVFHVEEGGGGAAGEGGCGGGAAAAAGGRGGRGTAAEKVRVVPYEY